MTKDETLHTLRTMNSVGSISLGIDSVIALIERIDLVEITPVSVTDEYKILVINQLIEELENSNMCDEITAQISHQIMDCIDDFEVNLSYNKSIELDEISIDEYKLSGFIEEGVRKWLNDKLS
jgi:hypothetical protein